MTNKPKADEKTTIFNQKLMSKASLSATKYLFFKWMISRYHQNFKNDYNCEYSSHITRILTFYHLVYSI